MKRIKHLITGAFAGLLLMLCASYLNAAIWTVTNCNDSGSGSLRDAVSRAQTGDTINFSPSTDGDTIILTSGGLQIDKKLDIEGNGPQKTIIDGDQKYTVFNTTTWDGTTLENMTIQNGSGLHGGGVVNSAILTIKNCLITNNTSTAYGGGIGNYATLIIEDCTISNNKSATCGGGVYICSSKSNIITGSTIMNNNSTSGGGIWNENTPLTITNSTIAENYGSAEGGGIDNYVGNLTIIGSTISYNFTRTHCGGGICSGGAFSISNSICANNTGSTLPNDFYCGHIIPIADKGHNIIGYSLGYKWAGEGDWISDYGIEAGGWARSVTGNTDTDTYTEVGTGTKGQLLLASNLTYNGGANLTLVPGTGSIAIGNGDPSLVGTTDQRGYIRKSTPDIGAFETNGIVAYRDNTPYTSIQSAIDSANPKDTIELIPTQIKESGINVDKNVIIEGAGADTTYVQADLTPGTATDRIFNITSDVTLNNMTIRNGDTSGIGGGMLCTGTGTVAINNCVVSDNIASEIGGIASTDGTLNLQNSMVLNNYSMSIDGNGGGILCDKATIQNSTIALNHSYGNAGGIEVMEYSNCGYITNIINSTIFANSAAGTGGGIDVSGGNTVNVKNSTIAGNSSAVGGGVNLANNSTFTLRNTIIANNKGQNDFNSYTFPLFVIDCNYNVVGVSTNCTWGKSGDWTDQNNTGTFKNGTKLGQLFLANALADNGGPTLTLNFTDPSSIAVYHAIPSANNYNSSLPTDQRGVVRTGNYTAIGAYNDNQSGSH